MEMGSNSNSNRDSMSGLKFGKKIYFEDGNNAIGEKPPVPAPSAQPVQGKTKGKGAGPSGQQAVPRCQVEGCNEDLSGTKAYYCRHKVCGMHSKAPRVIVSGMEQRFCQQCSRFHQLGEFDQGKRSCRRRLAGHNERRRKPPPGPLSSRYGRLSSSFNEPGRFRSFLLDFSYPRVPPTARDLWQSSVHRSPDDRTALNNHHHWPLDPNFPNNPSVTAQHGTHASYLPHALPVSDGGPLVSVPESSCALSLLSTQPWDNNNNNHNHGNNNEASHNSSGRFEENYSNWGFRGHHHEIGLGGVHGAGSGSGSESGQFSGELELALQRNGPSHMDQHGSTSGFGHSGHVSHWSL
ncbi:hypothetical protein LUZ60_003376 [Juncus effusus]|nr:hypothetical protein LUZ60_003376 [Juncus effusus]